MSAESTLNDNIQAGSTPIPAIGALTTLIDDDACAASGAYVSGGIIDVSGARKIVFYVDYNPAAASGRPAFLPLVSGAGAKPAAADDAWFEMSVWDGSVTAAALGGALPAGMDFTAAPDIGQCLQQRMLIVLKAAAAGTNEIRMKFTLNVDDARWLQLLYAEDGATGSPGTLTVSFALVV